VTRKHELIDYLIEHTGADPNKLKRISIEQLEQLVATSKKDKESFNELYKKIELKDEEISEKEEALKPENYLSSRELSDREMSDWSLMVLHYLWHKLTGQPELPFSMLGIMFGVIVFGTVVVAFYGIVVMPILYLLGMA
jgi:hypothetical protein